MKEIARHYKKKIPTLKRMKVKSDGCRSQYKCRKNFGPMAVWPHPTQEEIERGGVEEIPCICGYDATSCGRAMQSGLGIEMFHDFPVSHHGSGPVDSYGKDARRGMDRDSKFGRLHRYNFSHCLTWCENHMKRPAQDRKRKGKWSATNYIWRGYSDGLFPGDEYPVVPQDREWQQLSGSNEFYAFRAVHEYRPEIQAQFVPCYCSPHACPHMDITNAHSSTREAEFFTVHELDSRLQREDSDSEY